MTSVVTLPPSLDEHSFEHVLQQLATVPADARVLVDARHARWVTLLRSMTLAEFERTYDHPEMGPVTLRLALGLYAWHGRHHTAHVTGLRERMGW